MLSSSDIKYKVEIEQVKLKNMIYSTGIAISQNYTWRNREVGSHYAGYAKLLVWDQRLKKMFLIFSMVICFYMGSRTLLQIIIHVAFKFLYDLELFFSTLTSHKIVKNK